MLSRMIQLNGMIQTKMDLVIIQMIAPTNLVPRISLKDARTEIQMAFLMIWMNFLMMQMIGVI